VHDLSRDGVSDSGEVGRQVHWSTAIHCSVVNFEENALWNAKPVKTPCTVNASFILLLFAETKPQSSFSNVSVVAVARCCGMQLAVAWLTTLGSSHRKSSERAVR